jgi:hypothetical protein
MKKEVEKRKCQNCKTSFIIEPEDFKFYEKIKVPPPTFCPECRTIRRLCWRNEMSLFHRKCGFPLHEENIISTYHPDENLIIYDLKAWWGDGWDPLTYGKNYDFSKSFFEQWSNLYKNIPLQNISNSRAVNSDYCNVAEDSKDSYLSSASWKIERTFYSNRIIETKDCSDLYIADKLELCYDNVVCTDSYHLLYSFNSHNCVDSYFLYDCHGCTNCFGCSNLRSQSYCMWNEQLSKEEYTKRLEALNFKNYSVILELKKKFKGLYLKAIHRFAVQIKTVNCIGDNLKDAKNCKICFDASDKVENLKYTHWARKSVKDAYDCGPGVGKLELAYEDFDTGDGGSNVLFSSIAYYGNNIQYSFNCYGCSNLFGCIGLRNKSYCILNKQYRKEEYFEMVEKIKKHMEEMPYIDKRGIIYKYGEFFPYELSPYTYNETVAQDYFPITKEKALAMGYRWRERKTNEYQVTLLTQKVPDSLDEVSDNIIKEIIECAHKGQCEDRCSGAFRITREELNLYKRIGVPLPKLCFFCRHEERLRMRNPMKLWHRKCMKEGCDNEFETSYAPDRPEIVYCEECYKREVY